MEFRSPWRSRLFVLLIAVARRVLRPWGSSEDRFIRRLVSMQNERVWKHLRQRRPQTVLLIMPRCMKRTDCRCDVRSSVADCQDCELCPLGKISRLCVRFDIRALVAFRSHTAYAIARREQPDLIIAAACPDRLVKALRSVPDIPALLDPLTSMERPCVNATYDLSWIETQLHLVSRPRTTLARAATGS